MTKREFASECERRRQNGWMLFGAYEAREQIKRIGGIWDAKSKCWLMGSKNDLESIGAVEKHSKKNGTYWTLGEHRGVSGYEDMEHMMSHKPRW